MHPVNTQHHPDKNVNDPDASVRFLQVSEAYKRITDPSSFHDEEDDDGDIHVSQEDMHAMFNHLFGSMMGMGMHRGGFGSAYSDSADDMHDFAGMGMNGGGMSMTEVMAMMMAADDDDEYDEDDDEDEDDEEDGEDDEDEDDEDDDDEDEDEDRHDPRMIAFLRHHLASERGTAANGRGMVFSVGDSDDEDDDDEEEDEEEEEDDEDEDDEDEEEDDDDDDDDCENGDDNFDAAAMMELMMAQLSMGGGAGATVPPSLMQRMMVQRAVEEAMSRVGEPMTRMTSEGRGIGGGGVEAGAGGARTARPNWQPMEPTPPMGNTKGLRSNTTTTRPQTHTQTQSSRVEVLDSDDEEEEDGDDVWETDEDEDDDDDDEDDDEDDEDEDDDMMMMDTKTFPCRAVSRNDPRTMPCVAFSKGSCNLGEQPFLSNPLLVKPLLSYPTLKPFSSMISPSLDDPLA